MTDEALKERPKQQYTMEELVEMLDKIVWEKMNHAHITKLVIKEGNRNSYSYERD